MPAGLPHCAARQQKCCGWVPYRARPVEPPAQRFRHFMGFSGGLPLIPYQALSGSPEGAARGFGNPWAQQRARLRNFFRLRGSELLCGAWPLLPLRLCSLTAMQLATIVGFEYLLHSPLPLHCVCYILCALFHFSLRPAWPLSELPHWKGRPQGACAHACLVFPRQSSSWPLLDW
jgi:hypothetical protein